MNDHVKLRELTTKATPGPWTVGPYYLSEGQGHGVVVHDVCHADSDARPAERCVPEDAAFIAAASPDVVLSLLNEIDRLRVLVGKH